MTDKRFLFRRIWISPTDTVQDWVPGRPAELDLLIRKLGGAAAHFGEGAEQLRRLGGAQRLTQRILEHEAPLARDLSRQYAKAVDGYNAAIKAGDTTLPTRPPKIDPGRTTIAELVERINTAQGEVTEAAGAARRSGCRRPSSPDPC